MLSLIKVDTCSNSFGLPRENSYVASVPGPSGDTVAEVSILLNCRGDVRDKDVALAAVSKRQLWSDHTIKKKMNGLLVTTQCLDSCTQAAVVHWRFSKSPNIKHLTIK